jgi:ribosomal-protein-alanine N-acetyltransferase
MVARPTVALRPLARDDEADAFALWSDLETVKFTNWGYTPTREACAEQIERILRRYGSDSPHFAPAVIHGAEHPFLGLAGAVASAERPGEYGAFYILRRDQWGKGFASAALGALLERMEASGRVTRATATVVTTNTASWKVLERNGFRREALLPGHHQKHGLCLDEYLYARPLGG